MKRGDERTCDVCKNVIPRGTSFRSGWTMPGKQGGGEPASRLSFDIEADGRARFDLCYSCATAVEGMVAITVEAVDPLP